MSAQENPVVRTEEQEWKYASAAMSWYGWGSLIGAGIFFVCVAATIALLRYAFWS